MRALKSETSFNRGTLPCTLPTTYVPSKTEQSFMFNIKFHISGRSLVLNLKPSFTCINVCIYVRLYPYIVLLVREKQVCIEALKMYHLPSVLAAITRQHPMEIVAAPHLKPDDFIFIMEKEVMGPFYDLLKERRGDWGGDLQKIPVVCVGAQV